MSGTVARNSTAPTGEGRLILWVLLIVGVLALAKYLNAQAFLHTALHWIQGLGPWGWVLFVLLYIATAVFLLPAVVLTLGAGAVFGVAQGWVIVSIAATLAATAAFLVGRYFARGWVAKRIQGNPTFVAIDEAVAREGWKIVGLTRLSPAFPFNLLKSATDSTDCTARNHIIRANPWHLWRCGPTMSTMGAQLHTTPCIAWGRPYGLQAPPDGSHDITGLNSFLEDELK